MTTTRNRGNAPVASTFREALSIRDPLERRAWLLDRLWETYTVAKERSYTNKHGKRIPNPDGATQVKVLSLVLVASEGSPELDQRAHEAKKRLVDALEQLPELASNPDTVAQKRALLAVLKDAAIVATLKPNADVNAAVGTFRVVAQVLGIGRDEDDVPEAELQEMARRLLNDGKKDKKHAQK